MDRKEYLSQVVDALVNDQPEAGEVAMKAYVKQTSQEIVNRQFGIVPIGSFGDVGDGTVDPAQANPA